MSRLYKLLYIFLFCLACMPSANSQGGSNSPFSRFGIGDLSNGNFMHLRQMAGISAAYSNPYFINPQNPASYASLRATSFDIGVGFRFSNLDDGSRRTNVQSGNIEYIGLAFPLRNPLNEAFEVEKKSYRFGMGLSLSPYSLVEYDIASLDIIPDIGQIEREFKGSGGLYKALWGNGFQYKNFSIGANIGYLFGKLNYERNLKFIEIPAASTNFFTDNYSVSGFIWDVGAMYRLVLNKNKVEKQKTTPLKTITIGVSAKPSTDFRTNATQFHYDQLDQVRDTLTFESDIIGNGKLPTELNLGLVYQNGTKWALGINYNHSNWSEYQNDADPETLNDSYRIALGGFYRPRINSFSFKDRVQYRFGAFYQNDPRNIQDLALNHFGVTAGFGLPFDYQRKRSHINIGLTIGRRGDIDVLRETYVKLGLGLTFNDDEWFIKRKYD